MVIFLDRNSSSLHPPSCPPMYSSSPPFLFSSYWNAWPQGLQVTGPAPSVLALGPPTVPVLWFWLRLLWGRAFVERLLKPLSQIWTPQKRDLILTVGRGRKKWDLVLAQCLLSFKVSTLLFSTSLSSFITGSLSFQPLFKTSRSTCTIFCLWHHLKPESCYPLALYTGWELFLIMPSFPPL